MSTLGYLDMCGHALIGSITSLINSKKLSFKNSKNLIKIETCAGIITVTTNWNKKIIESISFVNQKSFSIKEDFIFVTIITKRAHSVLTDFLQPNRAEK